MMEGKEAEASPLQLEENHTRQTRSLSLSQTQPNTTQHSTETNWNSHMKVTVHEKNTTRTYAAQK